MEELVKRSQEYMGKPMNRATMNDIRDSKGMQDLHHPDGGYFFDRHLRHKVRTAWTMFFDTFNPFFNKAAGKTASSAVLGMACNNLPPSLKHQPENLFLLTVLPKDPSVVQIQFALRVFFENINQHWKTGICIETPTCPSRHRFRERSIISNIVTNMIEGSKMGGHAQHNSAKYFCSLYLLLKDDINYVHRTDLPPCTREVEYKNACRWHDATSVTERDEIFKETGVHWAILYYLEYWDATKMLADPMHNLFLGLVQHHCRVVLGIELNKQSRNVPGGLPVYTAFKNPNMDSLAKGREKLLRTMSLKTVKGLPKNILWMLCAEKKVNLEEHTKSWRSCSG